MPRSLPPLLVLLGASCGGGGSSTPIAGADVPPQLLACRARVDKPHQFAEIALRDDRNLGMRRVADRIGVERGVRLHPDGRTVVFARERDSQDPTSREMFVSSIDGSVAEAQLTQNGVRDDEPCWSPDGARILFASERTNAGGLWTIARDGSGEAPFVVTPTGGTDGEPDWNAATDRVVWSRADGSGRHTLWLATGAGSNVQPLTTGGLTIGNGNGDRAPSWSPDGQRIVFVRRIAPALAGLFLCDVASAAVTELLLPAGDVGTPRLAPAGDRVFFGLAEPAAGRTALRLATVPIGGGTPTLVWPDERWNLEGLELLPTLPALQPAAPLQVLDVTQAEVQIATASSAFGNRSRLAAVDGDEFDLTTVTIEGREIAGINVRFNLPVLVASSALELRVRLVARSTRAGGDSVLRTSIYNPVDERFDTAVELPAATTATTLTFSSSSLRHVTAERQLRVTVIADLEPGAREHLLIDLVEVVFVARAL